MKKVYMVSKNIPYKGVTNGVACEIKENGNIVVMMMAPAITPYEIECFTKRNLRLYHYERRGMSSLFLGGIFDVECNINPSYYNDDRYKLFQSKEEVEVECYIGDTLKDEWLCAKVFILQGKQLEQFKKGLELNEKQDRNTYDDWICGVLYANSFKTNCKQAINLGVCPIANDVEIHLV